MTAHQLPSGMVQVKAPLVVHRKVARDHFLMRLRVPEVARRSQPGQFVHVQCSHRNGRGQPSQGTVPLLRRPFSLLDVDPDSGTIDFIYKVVGLGTAALAEIPVGAKVDLLGPLGHPFEIPSGLKTAYLVGGGVGIPPLYLLAKWLVRQKTEVVAFLGARTKEWVICAPEFHALKIPVRIATDDGSLGYRGSVVDLFQKTLENVIARRPEGPTKQSHPGKPRLLPPPASAPPRGRGRNDEEAVQPTCLYVCGPTPMMAAAAKLARRYGLPAQVSLEERMGCAMGCCLGCVVEIATEPKTSHSRFQRVCTEGPVFAAESIVWKS